jgi:uncharacterized delta-60 repeat protein
MMSSYVFIDTRVQNWEQLLAGFASDVQVVLLDPARDGITQIAQALEGVTNLDAIHIISHGSQGMLYLGDSVLTSDNLDYYSSELETIGAALNGTGDILLYGCDVANGVIGQSFIDDLALYTSADVAASTDVTGSPALNGDWVLEANSGAIQTQALAPTVFEGLLAPPTLTAAGTLDSSFDNDGRRVDAIGTSAEQIHSMALQADGKIVVAGRSANGTNNDFALARYNTNGTLDTAFDTDGKRTDAIGTSTDIVESMALQVDGKIVVAGYSSNGSNHDFALTRYNADGSLDTTFDSDGKRTDTIGAGADVITSVVLQANGKIVAAGYSSNGANNDFALVRYNADGSLDTTFDADGKRTDTIGAGNDVVNSIALQADGKIVAAGYSSNGSNNDFALVRYNTDGSLDTTFDADGKRTDTIGAGTDVITSMVVQADGKIVAAGYNYNDTDNDFSLARYNTDGSLDTTFNDTGRRIDTVGAGNDQINSIVLQADGRIVVAGHSYNGTDNDFALARYNTNGSLDTTYDSDGRLTLSLGTGADVAYSVAIQSDGAIVAAGESSGDFAVVRIVGGGSIANTGIPDVVATENAPLDFAFNAHTFTDPDGGALTYSVGVLPSWLNFDPFTRTFNGTPGSVNVGSTATITVTATDSEALSISDSFVVTVQNNEAPVAFLGPDFDGDGQVTTPIGTGFDQITSMALQADGKIVAAGFSHNGESYDFALVRYNTDGSLDTAFDGDGKATTNFGSLDKISGVAIQADGKIVAGGVSGNGNNDKFALARYNTDGSLDTTFGSGGTLTTQIGMFDDGITSLALLADGKIVVAGTSAHEVPDSKGQLTDVVNAFALARYDMAGNLDTTFDGDGKLWVDFHDPGNDNITGIAVQADGKIVVAGYSIASLDHFAMARYNTDGSSDVTFGSNGKVYTALQLFGNGLERMTSMALQADGKIVVAGHSSGNFAIARFTTNGSLDTTFDGDGKVTTDLGGIEKVNGVALQADGKIVVAGYSENAANADFAFARYNADGSLDTTFDGDGKLIVPVGTGNDVATSVKIQSDGTIAAGGYSAGAGGTNDFAVIRLLSASGIEDTTLAYGVVLSLVMPVFTDPEGGQVTYSAALADGSALPAWLGFNVDTRTFSGTPTQSNVGRYDVAFAATDQWGASAQEGFSLAITNLTATAGSDTLYGGLGADTMTGLAGDDVYTADHAGDQVVEAAGAGIDLVRAWLSHTLAANVDNLTLTATGDSNGTGNTLNNMLLGNSGRNNLNGSSGNDTLDAGAGDDTLTGGTGDDALMGGSGNDWIYYSAASSGVSVNLGSVAAQNTGGAGVDTLSGIEHARGGNFNDTFIGTAANNIFEGYSGNDTLDGGAGNDTLNGSTGDDSLIGGSGLDWAYYNGAGSAVSVNLATGQSAGGGGNDTLNTIENILGGNSNDTLTGSSAANQLEGGAGNDTLDGGSGNDTLKGGGGNDYYIVNAAGDVVTEGTGGGTDSVQSNVSHTLAANVENLTLTGTGNAQATGNTLNNVLTGNAGNNILNGGAGVDTMVGGLGNDTYVLDYDVVIESAGQGTDLVQTTGYGFGGGSYTLGANVENLTMLSSSNVSEATGNSLANILTGNAQNNVLSGVGGNDTLDGGGGNDTLNGSIGDDRLTGGAGLDWAYYTGAGIGVVVDLTITTAQNTGGAGIDTLNTIENLLGGNYNDTLTGNSENNLLSGGGGSDTLSGSLGNDSLDGGSGNDTLDAGAGSDSLIGGTGGDALTGGAGDDTLTGGDGDDTLNGGADLDWAYYNGSSGVTVNLGIITAQNVNAGVDTLVDIENVLGGNYHDSLTGNSVGNILEGGGGDDTLDGGGGNDTLVGGGGDDHYFVDAAGDVVAEMSPSSFGNVDTVHASISYTLGTNVERLTLTGADNITANGNSLNNILSGNAGNNTINGGAGADTLTGGAGVDIFDYNSLTDAADRITDFTAGAGGDKLDIDTLLTALGYGGSDPLGAGYVQLLQSGVNTLVRIDSDGGANSFTTLVTLQNVNAASVTLADNFIV